MENQAVTDVTDVTVPAVPTEPQTVPTVAGTPTVDLIKQALENPSDEIGAMVEAFIANEVKTRLAGITPKRNTTDANAIQQDQFNRMAYKDRVKLFLENPTVYNKLVNGGKA